MLLQAGPSLSLHHVARDDMLHQTNIIAPVGMDKVRQQTVRATTDFAPDPLYQDPVVDVACACPPRVGSPTDQTIDGLTFRMRTILGNGELAARKGRGFSVLLCRTREVLYNDHIFGTPLSVVGLPSVEPLWEVSSFLARLYDIISSDVCSVKLKRSLRSPDAPYLLSNQFGRSLFPFNSYLPPNYSIWPGLSIFRPTNLADNNMECVLPSSHHLNADMSLCRT